MNKSFPAKVLLFGEYAVIKGSQALAIPFPKRTGKLFLPENWTDELRQSNQYIQDLAKYLCSKPDTFRFLDLVKLEQDLDSLAFETNIPIGYGLGSSGALVSSIYKAYARTPSDDPSTLQSQLAKMEACFHGESSGLDPLVSYLGRAVISQKGEENIIRESPITSTFQLLDTKISRSTAPLVEWFKAELESDQMAKAVDALKKENQRAIEAIYSGDLGNLSAAVKEISSIQWEHFRKLIPEAFQEYWSVGLQNENYFLKLCGAGGGGYILVFNPESKPLPFHTQSIN